VIDDAVIREAGRRLAAAASSPARVVLFGSHARGVAGPHSDLDFLVVEPDVDDEFEEAVRLRRSLYGLGVPADVVVVSRERADAWRHVTGTFLHAALKEGRVLEDDA
jgi:predicted nucleotidyltransferase